MRHLIPLLLLALAACAPLSAPRGDVLAIGDSVMARNASSGQSIPQEVARASGRSVTSRAVPLAQISNPSALLSAFGLDIGRQFDGGAWDTVILMGGANDLRSDCGCRACDATLAELASPDGKSGEIPDLARRIRATGARLMLVGYYGPVRGGGGGFDACNDELLILGRRLTRFAAADPGTVFVTARDVIDGKPELYAADKVHPSPAGSARIGALIARALPRAGG